MKFINNPPYDERKQHAGAHLGSGRTGIAGIEPSSIAASARDAAAAAACACFFNCDFDIFQIRMNALNRWYDLLLN
jgi:hypothetical protein